MTTINHDRPHAAMIVNERGDLRCYGYGETFRSAGYAFLGQVAGALPTMRSAMVRRVQFVELTDDQASEVAEMVAAPAVRWTN